MSTVQVTPICLDHAYQVNKFFACISDKIPAYVVFLSLSLEANASISDAKSVQEVLASSEKLRKLILPRLLYSKYSCMN